tara:strand:- start:205 stop:1035 length:831 start_codon:yes stop_codon:yes gene_type:complete
MSIDKNNQSLFDDNGRRIPFSGMRVFNEVSLSYYKINKSSFDYEEILSNSKKFADVDPSIKLESFESTCSHLKEKLENESLLKNLFDGVHVPFICPKRDQESDLGRELEKITLPSVASSFKASFPELHCKATLQGSSKLEGELSIDKDSRYESFLEAQTKGTVVGWYFPQVLQEYDIESQRAQMKTLPLHENLVLSGGLDTAAALVGSPDLLVNIDDYPPVLCLSALKHYDERLMLCFKAYGQHLEFWCMSQMLTPGQKQVSEQWSGGLTVFAVIE